MTWAEYRQLEETLNGLMAINSALKAEVAAINAEHPDVAVRRRIEDISPLLGLKKADERGAPASVGKDLTGMTLPAHGPFDISRFLSKPSSELARTAPSGPLAPSSTAVAPVALPRPDTISEGPGIDYRAKIGAEPESWTKQEQEEVTGIGPLVRNLGREAIGLVMGIGQQVANIGEAAGRIPNPVAAKAVVDDVTGMVSASIDAIHKAGTAIGTNPFAGGLNPIIEHAKVWFDQNLSAEDAKRKHEEIDRKYPDYAAARDQVDKNLFGTALGIVGIVAPLKGALVPKPIDLVKQARAGKSISIEPPRPIDVIEARSGEPGPVSSGGGIEGPAAGPAVKPSSPATSEAGIPPPELYHGTPKPFSGEPRINRGEVAGFGKRPVKDVFEGFYTANTPEGALMYARGNPANVLPVKLAVDAKILDLSDSVISQEVLGESSSIARSSLSSLRPPTKPFPFQGEFERFASERLNQARTANGKSPLMGEEYQKRIGGEFDPTSDEWNQQGLAAPYLESFVHSKGYDAIRLGRETIILNPKKAVVNPPSPPPELPPAPSQPRAGSAISRTPQETTVRPERPMTGGRESIIEARESANTAELDTQHTLKNPIKGTTGAEIVGYEWASTIEEGMYRDRKVSDWTKAQTSVPTGRQIVHLFWVREPNGKVTLMGVNAAKNALGLGESKLYSIAKREQAAQAYQLDAMNRRVTDVAEHALDSPEEATQSWRRTNDPNKMMWGTFEERVRRLDEQFQNNVHLLEKDGKYLRSGDAPLVDAMKERGWNDLGVGPQVTKEPPGAAALRPQEQAARPETPAVGKQPWEMRQPEFGNAVMAGKIVIGTKEGRVFSPKDAIGKDPRYYTDNAHRNVVEAAAQQGKISLGIQDYPDLAAKYGKQPPARPETPAVGKQPWEKRESLFGGYDPRWKVRHTAEGGTFVEDVTTGEAHPIEPWQVRLEEWELAHSVEKKGVNAFATWAGSHEKPRFNIKGYDKTYPSQEMADAAIRKEHLSSVKQAAQQGQIGAGIQDYSDLAAKYGKQPPARPETPIVETRTKDVTLDRLDEVKRATSFGGAKSSWTKKSPDAALTTTEQAILTKVGDGVDLGFVSNALVYSDFVHRLPMGERKALWSLVERGRLGVERVETKRGTTERLVSRTAVVKQAPPTEPVTPGMGTSAVGEAGAVGAGSRPLPMRMEPPSSTKPVTAADIAETIQKDFGIPIRVGHFRERALGIFKPRPEVVRAGEANALSTISHELGHYLDKKIMGGFARENRKAFSQRFGKWNDELVAMGKALYGTRKPTAGYRAEGFAEYVREWLTTGEAAKSAPQFHSFFEGEFLKNNPEIAAKLARVRDLTTNYREQGAIARHRGRIDYGGDFERTTFREKVSQGLRSARTMFTDDLFPLQRAQEKLLAAGGKPKTWFYDTKRPDLSPVEVARTLSKTAHSTAALFIRKGTFDFALNKTGPGLVEILKPFSPAETVEALDYAIARRLVDAAERGKKIPAEWRTDAEYVVKNQARPTDPAKPSYEDATKALTAFSDRVLDYVTDAGGLSPDAVAKFRESNVIYISLRRAFKESESIKGGSGGGARLANRGTAGSLKTLKGSGRPIADPIQTYVKTIEELVGMADKTRVARLLVELAEGTEGHGVLMDRVPPPLRANTFKLDQIKKALTEAGLDLEGADLDAAMTLWSNNPVYFGKDPIVSFVRSGKREFWEVFDKDLYRSLLSMDRYQLPKFLEWTLGKPTKLVRLGATGIRAGFSLITNPLRDAQTFALQTELSPSGAARALKAVVSDPEMRPMFSRSGVSMAQPLGLDRKAMDMAVSEVLNGKRTLSEVVGHPIEALREGLSITESGPRLVEFSGVYQQYPRGLAAARVAATNAASDVTVNFRRMGTMGAVINQIIPFFNPAIQGTAKMYRLVRTNPKKAGLVAVVNLTVPSLALWWQNKDEPWYKSLPDWQKYGFWNFKVGEKIVKIPRPFEWGYFFAALPEAAADASYRKDPSNFKGFGVQLAKSMNPVDLPAAVGPLLEVAANYDSFKGHSIVPFFMDRNNFAEEEYFPWTPELVKKAGAMLGVSPLKIEHLLSGYTGGLAKDVLYAADDIMKMAAGHPDTTTQAADWPVVGRLFGREFDLAREEKQAEQQIELMETRYKNKIAALVAAGKDKEADDMMIQALAALETERMRTQRRLNRGK
jgi:hypothetical protein